MARARVRGLVGRPGLLIAVVVTVVAVVVVARTVDTDLLSQAAGRAAERPVPVALTLAAFALAFVLRTLAWQRVVPALGFGQAWSGIHVSLGANHLLPLRLGEPMRVLSVVRRAGIPVEVATASTVTLRAADVLTMVAIGVVVSPVVFVRLIGPAGWLLLGLVGLVALVSWRWLVRLVAGAKADAGHETTIRLPGLGVVGLAAGAWVAESVVVWEVARWVGLEISWTDALLVATVAVAAQIAAIAPGGFGTYEAATVAAYAALGVDPDVALVAALAAHGLKTTYSLLAGAVAVVVPAPGLLGRLRLRLRPRPRPPGGPDRLVVSSGPEPAEGRILFFLPAFDEARSVGACVRRVPDQVVGRPVDVLVIDDGSTDATAEVAAAAGAEVLRLDRNRGLGAAVRIGLAEGVRRRAAVTVFCDADGEYPPEELERLVAPIVEGRADYVTGSRFLGRIDSMRPHRRVGNIVLTNLLSIAARTRITDGQTGYRAFSPAAAAGAEIIHDFNYAQVLTLDLLAKGFRLHEVPITYHFRTEGDSFIRLGRYLRNVGPAVYRELNSS